MKTMLKILAGAIVLLLAQASMASMAAGLPANELNWSPQNKNEALLSRWPKIKGYPHIFVLDGEGRLLHSQNTDALEADKDYDKEKFLAFLRQHRGR